MFRLSVVAEDLIVHEHQWLPWMSLKDFHQPITGPEVWTGPAVSSVLDGSHVDLEFGQLRTPNGRYGRHRAIVADGTQHNPLGPVEAMGQTGKVQVFRCGDETAVRSN